MEDIKFNFTGKTALVTGASKGIGFETAKKLSNAGASVIMVARNIENLKNAEKEIAGETQIFSADLSKLNDVKSLVQFLNENYKKIDILISNAGTNIRKETENVNEEEFEFLFNTNLRSAYDLSRLLLPLMKNSEQGNIIFMSSVAGLTHLRTGALYGMTKAALIQLTKNLSVEWAKYNIRVNAVAPWYISTPLAKQVLQNKEYAREVWDRTPMRRIGTTEEVAYTSLFLCSSGAGFITGQTIAVDGGFSVFGF